MRCRCSTSRPSRWIGSGCGIRSTPVRFSRTARRWTDSSSADLFESVGRVPEPGVGLARPSWTAEAGQLWLDVVYAQRRLRANPGFTAFSVLTLALGIGATTALYSVIYSTILRPLNVRDLQTLVNIYHADPMGGGPMFWTMSQPDFEDLRKTQTVLTGVAAHAPFAQIVIANGVGERARGETVTGEYFSLLGLQPAAGRLLQPADDRPGAALVAVIDHRTWRRRFDARPDIAGQTIRMAGRDFEIVGVAPPDFTGSCFRISRQPASGYRSRPPSSSALTSPISTGTASNAGCSYKDGWRPGEPWIRHKPSFA